MFAFSPHFCLNLIHTLRTTSSYVAKAGIDLASQHPQGLEKIRELESSKDVGLPTENEAVFEKPVFVSPLTGQQELVEGQHAHFQARVVPIGDPNLRIQWFVNGIQLPTGSFLVVCHYLFFVFVPLIIVQYVFIQN
jgi:hypothetical protein